MGILDAPGAPRFPTTAYPNGWATAPRPGAVGIAVADNCHATALDTPAETKIGTSRCPHTVGVDCADLRLVYMNWSSKSSSPYIDIEGTATLSVNASIEISGTIYRVTFGGRTTGTIDAGGMLVSDPLGVEVAVGTVIYSRTFISASAWYSNKKTPNVGGAGGFTTTTDLTAPGSGSISDGGLVTLYTPAAILGVPKAASKALLVAGHSIANGYGDGGGTSFPSYAIGFLARAGGGFMADAARGKIGLVNVALSGDQLSNHISLANHYRRASMGRFCTHVAVDYATNDLSNSLSLATIQANLLTVCDFYARRGLKVLVCTEFPRTASSDNWTTTGGQTPHSSSTTRVSLNNWIRAGSPIDPTTKVAVAVGTSGALLAGQAGHPITNYFEVADTIETARDSSLWLPPGRSVADAAITSGAQVLTSATANFTSADLGAAVVVNGAGAAGAALVATRIAVVTNSTTVTLDNTASTTVTGATAFIDVKTIDGIHPTAHGHVLASAGIDLTKLT